MGTVLGADYPEGVRGYWRGGRNYDHRGDAGAARGRDCVSEEEPAMAVIF
jgi:hypothetical protein